MSAMFLFRWLAAALIAVLLLPLSWQLLLASWRQGQGRMPDAGWVALGLVAGIAWMLWRRPNWLLHTVVHETAHALVCLLLGVRIHTFQASDGKGGKVVHSRTDPVRTTIIALAPYTLPLLLLLGLAAHWWIRDPDWQPWLSALVGFLYIDHLHGLYHNIRLNFWGRQADLARAGRLLSVVSIAAALCLSTSLTLWVLIA